MIRLVESILQKKVGRDTKENRNHSCETQLLSVVEEMQLAIDHHYSVDLIFIDFRKVFDTVPKLLLTLDWSAQN